MRKFLFFLFILIFLFLTLEALQRCRHAFRSNNIAPLFYGFRKYYRLINIYRPQGTFFREPFTILEKNEGKNILFIGASSTYGVYNDNFHTYPYLLQSKIRGISCLNAAESGALSDQFLDILKQRCDEYCIPDMVVFYIGYNDIFSKGPLSEYPTIEKIIDIFSKYSFLIVTIKEKILILDMEKKRDYAYRMNYVKEFNKNIEDCIKFAQHKNIKVVLIPEVLIAEKFTPTNEDYRSYSRLYVEIPEAIQGLAEKYNCHFLNPRDILYDDWKNNFVGIVHLTDKGNEVLSTFLAKNLPFEKK